MNLPLANKEDPPAGLTPGEQLLELASNREEHPIPVMLIVSGKLHLASLSNLNERLQQAFAYGQMVNKKDPNLGEEIRKGLQKAHEYMDVGIHIQDGGSAWFPTLSPREDDLLRRCVLSKPSWLGVDVQWWTAENGPSLSNPTINDGPTKVLMGCFLLNDGMECSRPTFFKFEPAGNAKYVCRDVTILDQKLSHVNVQYSGSSRTRALLVTQSVTDSRPVSLDKFLNSEHLAVDSSIPHLVADIASQLEKLGGVAEDQVLASDILWKFHRIEILKGYKPDHRATLKKGLIDPIPVLEELYASQARIWVSKRSCIHGDLNATNVAVDPSCADRPHAYIFDAAGIHADMDSRDLAYLELTTLLFSNDPLLEPKIESFQPFYTQLKPDSFDETSLHSSLKRTAAMLLAIRERVSALKNSDTYPLVLFDTALIQLGGLVAFPSRNKIVSPHIAYVLAAWSAAWLKVSLPSIFAGAKASQSPAS